MCTARGLLFYTTLLRLYFWLESQPALALERRHVGVIHTTRPLCKHVWSRGKTHSHPSTSLSRCPFTALGKTEPSFSNPALICPLHVCCPCCSNPFFRGFMMKRVWAGEAQLTGLHCSPETSVQHKRWELLGACNRRRSSLH